MRCSVSSAASPADPAAASWAASAPAITGSGSGLVSGIMGAIPQPFGDLAAEPGAPQPGEFPGAAIAPGAPYTGAGPLPGPPSYAGLASGTQIAIENFNEPVKGLMDKAGWQTAADNVTVRRQCAEIHREMTLPTPYTGPPDTNFFRLDKRLQSLETKIIYIGVPDGNGAPPVLGSVGRPRRRPRPPTRTATWSG